MRCRSTGPRNCNSRSWEYLLRKGAKPSRCQKRDLPEASKSRCVCHGVKASTDPTRVASWTSCGFSEENRYAMNAHAEKASVAISS